MQEILVWPKILTHLMNHFFKSTLIGLSILTIGSVISCNSDETIVEDTNDTYLDYEVLHDSDANQTTVSARFTNGIVTGSEVILQENESVTFDGDLLQYDEANSEYKKSYEGRIMEGDFVFTSAEGKVYTNSMVDYETIGFPSDFTSFSKSEGLTLVWDGAILEINEHVEVGIGDPAQGSWAGDVFDGEGLSSFQFTPEGLTTLDLGTWPAKMIRAKFIFTNGAGTTRAGSRIFHKYQSTIQVEVTE